MAGALIFTFGTALLLFVIVFYILRSTYWKEELTDLQLTAKQFFSLYNIAPEKWSFISSGYHVVYHDKSAFDQGDCAVLSFKTYVDALRVAHYFHKKEKQIKNIEAMKFKGILLKAWQKDVEAYKRKSVKDLFLFSIDPTEGPKW